MSKSSITDSILGEITKNGSNQLVIGEKLSMYHWTIGHSAQVEI